MNEKKLTVAIADDEEHIRVVLKTAVERMDADVKGLAANGYEAVTLYGQENPDVMLLDINMPVKSGIDALKEIMARDPDAVVIILTSVSDMNTVLECKKHGASGFIRKDTPVHDIPKLIKETWDRTQKE